MITLRTVVITLLVVLEVIAIHSMWVQMYQNGFFKLMHDLREVEPELLPCLYMSLDNKYTHIRPVDDVIVGIECAFSTIVDGSNPTLSLFSFKDTGALFVICILL